MEGLLSVDVIVGIVEGPAVRLRRLGARAGVVQHLLHAVFVARVARDAQQIVRHFEVTVGIAWRLENPVGRLQLLSSMPLTS